MLNTNNNNHSTSATLIFPSPENSIKLKQFVLALITFFSIPILPVNIFPRAIYFDA